ncbi:MAG TPA: hypothetical protein VK788_25995 [Terriglobales bacterium]|nr:hypothetical protein [Terriglobales bacterium]
MNNMPRQDQNSVVAVFSQHSAAENAIKELKGGGFDIKKLAVVGRDYQTESDVVGFYNTGDRMKYWGKWGAFWGGLWGLLFGAAFLIVPGIGPVVAAGSVVDWIIAALEGAVVVGGVSALDYRGHCGSNCTREENLRSALLSIGFTLNFATVP